MIIIFNGPPGSGKDEAASYFKHQGFKHVSFKYVLFKETIEYFGVPHDWFMRDYNDRKIKERPESALRGFSRREALIHVSEEIIKPVKGLDFFGVCVAKEVRDDVNYCISDGGFVEELIPIINKIGTENIVLVQLTRDGCDYSADSRRYFDGNLVKEYVLNHQTPIKKQHVLPHKFTINTYRVHNNGAIKDFHGVLQEIHQSEKAIDETAKEGKVA